MTKKLFNCPLKVLVFVKGKYDRMSVCGKNDFDMKKNRKEEGENE